MAVLSAVHGVTLSMPLNIADYALIGNCRTGALVGRDGSIDWLCLPRFDSDACFAAILSTVDNGRWSIAPAASVIAVRRSYKHDSLILETTFASELGSAKLIDFMPVGTEQPMLVRIVEGLSGQLRMHTQLVLRFGYGRITPWVRRQGGGIVAVGGPDAVVVHSDIELHGEEMTTVADFTIACGQQIAFSMSWFDSFAEPPARPDAARLLEETLQQWRDWVGQCNYQGKWRESVVRSLITLKALTYAPTGGIVAAPTTSLPEKIGSSRNWDYRFCWLRDATMTVFALMSAGYVEEAAAWREWLLHVSAGSPNDLQSVYGVCGERRLTELTLDWLAGYENSQPVRIGNAAAVQLQLDVYGELIDTMFQCRMHGLDPDVTAWNLEVALIEYLERNWNQPDHGIWEVRGPRQHFTHSKVMAWVALDRAIKSVERLGLQGPVDRWRAVRQTIHEDVCRHGHSERLHSFVQSYGSEELDAALLMIPLVGFLPPEDTRVTGTIQAIERALVTDGFVRRYGTSNQLDSLPPGEGVFLPCSLWLADCYVLTGRRYDAEQLFERVLRLRNDVGLLSEEYDPLSSRLVGNFPQALSHIALVNTAINLSRADGTAQRRSKS